VVVPGQLAAAPAASTAPTSSEQPVSNTNGKPHPAMAPVAAAASGSSSAAIDSHAADRAAARLESAVSAPASTAPRRTPQVAIISEAQSPPAASAAAPLPFVALPVAEETRVTAMPRPAAAIDTVNRHPAPGEAPPKLPVRIRRLIADADQMTRSFSGAGPIRVKSTTGDPPELYQVEYHVKGLQKGWLGRPKTRDTHVVEIQLTSEYPRVSPKCRMLTPVFHPNIDETTVCVTDHWTAGERLVDLVVRIGEMLAYQAYNIKSPLNGEAAMWADLHPAKLPVDARNLHPGGN
jgi:ubiquitin-protein ligase